MTIATTMTTIRPHRRLRPEEAAGRPHRTMMMTQQRQAPLQRQPAEAQPPLGCDAWDNTSLPRSQQAEKICARQLSQMTMIR